MSINVAEYFTKMQNEGLATIKQAQDQNLAAIGKLREFATEFAEKPGTIPTLENLPTPTQLVEMSFGFASQILELRKAYTLKIADLLVETQKQAEAQVKAATATVTTVNGTVNAPHGKPVTK